MRWRLGLPCVTPGTVCPRCSRVIDPLVHHALTCRRAKGKYRAHGAVLACVAQFAREARLEAANEVVVPALAKGAPGTAEFREARLDLELWGRSAGLCAALVDATVCHPPAARYLAAAARSAGAAAKVAEAKKAKRYPAARCRGAPVWPFAVETFGRLGATASDLLASLAAEASRVDCLFGAPPRARLRGWHARLSTALARALARTVREAARPPAADLEGGGSATVGAPAAGPEIRGAP